MHCPDSWCVPSQTSVELTYVSTSSPAHSGGKLLSHTLQWNNLPAQGNLHWSWADPHSQARPLKFWPLRLLGDAVSHCEFFFPASIGCIPSVRKCVTAFQKQHLSEITPRYISVIHSVFTFIDSENILLPNRNTMASYILRTAQAHQPSGCILVTLGSKGTLDL